MVMSLQVLGDAFIGAMCPRERTRTCDLRQHLTDRKRRSPCGMGASGHTGQACVTQLGGPEASLLKSSCVVRKLI